MTDYDRSVVLGQNQQEKAFFAIRDYTWAVLENWYSENKPPSYLPPFPKKQSMESCITGKYNEWKFSVNKINFKQAS